jgi:hypothetical protein
MDVGPVNFAWRLSSTRREYGDGLGSFANIDGIEQWAPINAERILVEP